MEKKNHTRESLEKEFSVNKKLKIVFTKKDGTERTMICSRHADLLPKVTMENVERTTAKPPSETNFPVFDLEKGAWRTFTIANLISIEEIV